MPRFSIITVCFNSESTIERTLKSVLEQSFKDYEYIIIDGKSSDHTLDIIRKYETKFGGKMRWISEPDRGIYDAMNKGIKMSVGEFIGIVNSDDYYEKDALEKIISAWNGYDYNIIYGLQRKVFNGKEVSVYMNNPEFIEETMITHPTCFVSRRIYEEFGNYKLKYKYSSDYEFMLRIRNIDKIKYISVCSIISNFTMGGASSTVEGYRESLRLKHEYGLSNGWKYYFYMMKSWIAMKLKR